MARLKIWDGARPSCKAISRTFAFIASSRKKVIGGTFTGLGFGPGFCFFSMILSILFERVNHRATMHYREHGDKGNRNNERENYQTAAGRQVQDWESTRDGAEQGQVVLSHGWREDCFARGEVG